MKGRGFSRGGYPTICRPGLSAAKKRALSFQLSSNLHMIKRPHLPSKQQPDDFV
jgi:hypothetical protein